jgi:type III secretory pathway component EscU
MPCAVAPLRLLSCILTLFLKKIEALFIYLHHLHAYVCMHVVRALFRRLGVFCLVIMFFHSLIQMSFESSKLKDTQLCNNIYIYIHLLLGFAWLLE